MKSGVRLLSNVGTICLRIHHILRTNESRLISIAHRFADRGTTRLLPSFLRHAHTFACCGPLMLLLSGFNVYIYFCSPLNVNGNVSPRCGDRKKNICTERLSHIYSVSAAIRFFAIDALNLWMICLLSGYKNQSWEFSYSEKQRGKCWG